MLQLLDLFRTGYTAALDVEADDSARLFSAFKLESLSVCSESNKCCSVIQSSALSPAPNGFKNCSVNEHPLMNQSNDRMYETSFQIFPEIAPRHHDIIKMSR